MNEKIIDELKKATSGEEFIEILFKIFGLDGKRGSAKKLVEKIGTSDTFLSNIRNATQDDKEVMGLCNYKRFCQAIYNELHDKDSISISLGNVQEIIKNYTFMEINYRGMKSVEQEESKEQEENFHENGLCMEKLQNRLIDDISNIVNQLGYQWKEGQPRDSEFEYAIIGEIQLKEESEEFEIFRTGELEWIYGIELSDANYRDVVTQVAEMAPKETGIIILCCKDESILDKAKNGYGFKQNNNIWIKLLENGDKPQLIAHCKGGKHKNFMKELLKRISE